MLEPSSVSSQRLPLHGRHRSGGLGAVSAGISEALFTAVGLSSRIPAVSDLQLLRTVIERYTVDMNGVGSELVSFIMRGGLSQPAQAPQGQFRSQHPPQGLGPSPGHRRPMAVRSRRSRYGSQHPGPVNAHGPTSVHPAVAPAMGSGYPPPGYPPR